MKKYAVGVDLGGTSVKMGFFTTEGELLEKWEIPTRTENGGTKILPDIADAVRAKLDEKNLTLKDIEGVGLDLPGVVLPNGTVNKCVNLGWEVMRADDVLTELLDGTNVAVINDANSAALGEMWKGAGIGKKSLVMVTLGTGVGGGVIVDGKIIPGSHGSGGEIGHMPVVEPEDEPEACGCGKHGCLEQYTSGNGIARLARRRLAQNNDPSSLRAIGDFTAHDVYNAAKAGDEVALQITDKFAKILGKALACIASVNDPEAFVIGGGVSKNGSIVTDGIIKYYKEYAFHALKNTDIVLAELGNDSGMYGAVKQLIG
ncbi:MAG: ROK family glucokinase [Lachnospiraceae bacterium]|jgi:glucokinase|nr:ROK family glucokinase [Lachnospiraceae bacterium]